MTEQADSKRKICIIGAGLSGLVCGMRLAKAGFAVHIVEELTYAGGLMASTRIGKEYLELLPHHIRKTDKALLSLIKEEGMDGKLEWFDSLWYGKASRKKLGYLNDGFSGLINSLIQDITDNGGQIHYSSTVTDIMETDGDSVDNGRRYKVTCILSNSARNTVECDYVIYTGSCRAFVNVSHNLPIPLNTRDQLMNITYSACISLMTVLKRQHSEVYFQKTSESLPFNRIINHSNCFGQRNYGGNVVYLVGNCSITDNLWVASDSDIMENYFAAFRKLYPMIKKADVKAWRLTKIRYACADIYPREDLLNPLEGLFVCADGLYENNTDDKPVNRMEHVVQIANRVCTELIRSAEATEAADEEDKSIVTPIA